MTGAVALRAAGYNSKTVETGSPGGRARLGDAVDTASPPSPVRSPHRCRAHRVGLTDGFYKGLGITCYTSLEDSRLEFCPGEEGWNTCYTTYNKGELE